MKLSNWYNYEVIENKNRYNHKFIKYNFSLLCDEYIMRSGEKDILSGMRESGVWLIQDNNHFIESLKKEEIRILVGFHPIRLHLGHLSLMKELSFYSKYKAEFVFLIANHEKDNVSPKIIDDFWNILGNYCDLSGCAKQIYWDDTYLDLIKLTDKISSKFTLNKILRTFGWDNQVNPHRIRSVLVGVASFLVSNILEYKTTLALLDINQMPFYELCKVACEKCGLEMPSFAFIKLFPSINDINKRMSIKDEKSTIFLDEKLGKIETALKKTFSGGYTTVSKEIITDLTRCSFFKVMELLFNCEQINQSINDCLKEGNSCSECKRKNIPVILSKLQYIRKGVY